MRGQVSAEYMLLFIVSLSMLMISLAALTRIRADAASGLESARFGSSAAALAAAVREVCALGAGNGGELALEPGLAVESEPEGQGWVFRISDGGNRSRVSFSPCRVAAEPQLESHVYVENEEGEIAFRER